MAAGNPIVIKCPSCGADNQLPRLHCAKCGARLDAVADTALHDADARAGRGKSRVWPWIRRLAFLSVLVVFCLLLWPCPLELSPAKAIDSRRYLATRALLSDALDRGAVATESIRDTDVNAFLVHHARPAEGSSWSSRYEGAVVRFSPGAATAMLSMTRGPFRFTLQLTARPDGGGLRLDGARFGHMPLPVAAMRWVLESERSPFRVFEEETRILQNATSCGLSDGVLTLGVGGAEVP